MSSLPQRVVAVSALLTLWVGATAHAQGVGAAPPASKPAAAGASGSAVSGSQTAQQVDQFLHFILIARPDQAQVAGKAILGSGISDADLAQVVDGMNISEKLEKAIRRGRAMEGVGPLVGEFEVKLERGRRDLARDSARLKQAMTMLDGTLREQGLGRARLVAGGEYAVPVLLGQIVDGRNPKLEVASTAVLVEIKRLSVAPLMAALPSLDPSNQRKVVEILAQVGWPTAVPVLQQLAEDPRSTVDVRDAATRAVATLGGAKGTLAQSYTNLALDYFRRQPALLPYADDAINNLWEWDGFGGLKPTPVPTAIYCDVMAMRMAERALKLDPAGQDALAIYVAADLRRQNDLPSDAKDPVYGDRPLSPQFFATVVGPAVGQLVLSLAVDSKDTLLIRDAIEALAQTGGAGITIGVGGRAPLIECLAYPDRRVQYDAAIVLGAALPKQAFPKDTAVVPLLASAVRTAGTQYAAVVAADEEDRRQLAGSLTSLGYTVVGTAGSWEDLTASALASSSLDLVAARGRTDQVQAALAGIRASNLTAATPVLVVAAAEDRTALENALGADRRVNLWTAGAPQDTFKASVDALILSASGGPIAEDEAVTYAMRSLETLRDIAVSGNSVYRIQDAEKALSEALDTRSGSVRMTVADVLALIPTASAQQKLLDAALAAKDEEQVQLLDRVAVSGRRWGAQVEQRQASALRALVQSAKGTSADAAARAYGALNLPSDEAVKLICK